MVEIVLKSKKIQHMFKFVWIRITSMKLTQIFLTNWFFFRTKNTYNPFHWCDKLTRSEKRLKTWNTIQFAENWELLANYFFLAICFSLMRQQTDSEWKTRKPPGKKMKPEAARRKLGILSPDWLLFQSAETANSFWKGKTDQSRICGKGVGLSLFPSDSLSFESYEQFVRKPKKSKNDCFFLAIFGLTKAMFLTSQPFEFNETAHKGPKYGVKWL